MQLHILDDVLDQVHSVRTQIEPQGSGKAATVELVLESGQKVSFPHELFIEKNGAAIPVKELRSLLAQELKLLKAEIQERDVRNLALYRELLALYKDQHPLRHQPSQVRKALKELIEGYPDILQAYDHTLPLPDKKVRNRPKDP